MMRSFFLKEISDSISGQIIGRNAENKSITGISIDSRTLSAGQLFIAIKGPYFDGHQFLQQACEAGAAAAVVSKIDKSIDLIQVLVKDTFLALGKLGQLNRLAFQGLVFAITGSCGKTSVKEMLSAILAEQFNVLSTLGNLNNGYGVPLTLSQLEPVHDYAVVELGTSSPGEISYIAGLTQPDIAILINAAEAHLEGLGSVEGVAKEKGYILDASGDKGVAILNYDDSFYSEWLARTKTVIGRKTVAFSLNNSDADCYASDIKTSDKGMDFILNVSGSECPVNLGFFGLHQVSNACCAAAAAFAAGIKLEVIAQGLENAHPYQRRGMRYKLSGVWGKRVTVFDETYNANPKAMRASIDLLSMCSGKRIMVFGDMLELGRLSSDRHRDIGVYAKQKGIDYFAGFGALAELACAAFTKDSRHFSSKAELVDWIKTLIRSESGHTVSVLVKGSKGMEMYDVVRSLVGPEYEGER
ncbi:MAG: UDP-N-acetylmuramoyl-tripeptide--D-alanyl-D-alanine ligase [Endozoicomonas sp. (ex Botrylloides leachii)]|nr:UDP-N-acetylmuramoyl-tripeptide--D-alanyl-D-alanine ligase [Endozoicomonas sp. (ex Botrylloides leachii)]